MELTVFCSDKAQVDWRSFASFVRAMAARLAFGWFRYGDPAPTQRYATRAQRELSAYRRTGNAEHLFNAANYCWLESVAPEIRAHHHDAAARSATREEFGGEREAR